MTSYRRTYEKTFESECFSGARFSNHGNPPHIHHYPMILPHECGNTCREEKRRCGRQTSNSLLLFYFLILTLSAFLLLSPLIPQCLFGSLRSRDPVSFCAQRRKELFGGSGAARRARKDLKVAHIALPPFPFLSACVGPGVRSKMHSGCSSHRWPPELQAVFVCAD